MGKSQQMHHPLNQEQASAGSSDSIRSSLRLSLASGSGSGADNNSPLFRLTKPDENEVLAVVPAKLGRRHKKRQKKSWSILGLGMLQCFFSTNVSLSPPL
jgi:hypothetical protein